MSKNNRDITARFRNIRKQAYDLGLTDEDILNCKSLKSVNTCNSSKQGHHRYRVTVLIGVLGILCLTLFTCDYIFYYRTSILESFFFNNTDKYVFKDNPCIIGFEQEFLDFFRPPVPDCEFCKTGRIERRSNISLLEFEERYINTARPVVIEDGQRDWSAKDIFSFEFFKELYSNHYIQLRNDGTRDSDKCQFISYREFKTLEHVFNMSQERAHLKNGSKTWYIGWRNCQGDVAEILREYYKRPYFLPAISEASRTDWLYMGFPGPGAEMHIDGILMMTWQAQITGYKKWILQAPLECYFECEESRYPIETILRPGDILVVDTDKWFHGTEIMGNNISISLGNEFD